VDPDFQENMVAESHSSHSPVWRDLCEFRCPDKLVETEGKDYRVILASVATVERMPFRDSCSAVAADRTESRADRGAQGVLEEMAGTGEMEENFNCPGI
jgi:hypothetical protein